MDKNKTYVFFYTCWVACWRGENLLWKKIGFSLSEWISSKLWEIKKMF